VEAVILFPAIDLKDGLCVRLEQGDMGRATVFNREPLAQAQAFAAAGFEYLHVVDLDGAFAGKPMNAAAVEQILSAVPVPLQLGGGIRDRATIDGWLGRGVARVIIGTAAVRDPALVKEAARAEPGRVAVGLDARDGKVAVEGWAKNSELSALEIARRFEDAGVAAIIYTDIARDGLLKGLNIEATIALANAVSIPVIAAGGLASLDDVRALLGLYTGNIAGAVAGRALYDGRLDARAALALIRATAADALTGLLTRRAFAGRRQLIAARMQREDRWSAILFDIDGFNRTTYDHGADVSDEVLRRIGAALAGENAVAARTGGDEFALLLSGGEAAHAATIAERYLRELMAMRIGEMSTKIVCSFGVAARRAGESIDGMMARAKAALDAAKQAGGGRVVVADGAAVA
jgi:phosphoribosylformimino-5-aminoimidazole carboxamide ribotide isomerase